jgi:hypothetical protein
MAFPQESPKPVDPARSGLKMRFPRTTIGEVHSRNGGMLTLLAKSHTRRMIPLPLGEQLLQIC